MDNHVHFMAVPRYHDSMARTIGITQMRHTQSVNRKQGWKGHLWTSRFYSTPLDQAHFVAAVRYIELNPVRAKMVDRADEYHWSSARAHVHRIHDPLLSAGALFGLDEEIDNWASFLSQADTDKDLKTLRECTMSGRPCGSETFVDIVEKKTGRDFTRRPVGRRRAK